MAQKYQELSDKIVGLVGGKANVQFLYHCVTRLRFNVKDESAVKKDEIENCPVFSAPVAERPVPDHHRPGCQRCLPPDLREERLRRGEIRGREAGR